MIEVLRTEDLERFSDRIPRDEHRAEDGFLGLEVVRRHTARRRSLAKRTDRSHQPTTVTPGGDKNVFHTLCTGPAPLSPVARTPSPRRPPGCTQALLNTSSRPVGRLDTEGTAARNNRRDYKEDANTVKREK